jgi:hypothetical protein
MPAVATLSGIGVGKHDTFSFNDISAEVTVQSPRDLWVTRGVRRREGSSEPPQDRGLELTCPARHL